MTPDRDSEVIWQLRDAMGQTFREMIAGIAAGDIKVEFIGFDPGTDISLSGAGTYDPAVDDVLAPADCNCVVCRSDCVGIVPCVRTAESPAKSTGEEHDQGNKPRGT